MQEESNNPDNPYRPPQSRDNDTRSTPGSPWKAIALGTAVDIGGSIASSIVIAFCYGIYLGAQGISPEELGQRLSTDLQTSWLAALSIAIGCFFSAFGGFMCARIVKRSEYAYGGLQAMLATGLGMILSSASDHDQAHELLILLGIASTMIGVHLGARRNRRN